MLKDLKWKRLKEYQQALEDAMVNKDSKYAKKNDRVYLTTSWSETNHGEFAESNL
jgi:hypothetical protein